MPTPPEQVWNTPEGFHPPLCMEDGSSGFPFCLHQVLQWLWCFYILPSVFVLEYEKALMIILGFVVVAFFLRLGWGGGQEMVHTVPHISHLPASKPPVQLSTWHCSFIWSDLVERAVLGSSPIAYSLYLETLWTVVRIK